MKHKWHKFKAGDRAWTPSHGWVILFEHCPGLLSDGSWVYDENGIAVGVSVPVPLLFRNEIKPEDWPQPEPPLPVVLLPDLKDGDPIRVRNSGDTLWHRRRFARFSPNGKVSCYLHGDSWCSGGMMQDWDYFFIPTPEELSELPDLKDGDPIWVRDGDGQRWLKKIFARFDSRGNVLTYTNDNKWTSDGRVCVWLQYRIPTPEELSE